MTVDASTFLTLVGGVAGAIRSATTKMFKEESRQHVKMETKGKGMSPGNILLQRSVSLISNCYMNLENYDRSLIGS